MNDENYFFSNNDLQYFREWLKLNIYNVTWKGKYLDEFEEFWQLLFSREQELQDLIKGLDFAESVAKTGPLINWLNFLKEKLLAFTFIHKNVSLFHLSRKVEIPISYLATVLRNFFIECFPYLENHFNRIFHVGNMASKSLGLTFKNIIEDKKISPDFYHPSDDDILSSLEVTLFEEWGSFLKKLRRHFNVPNKKIKKVNPKDFIRKSIRPTVELILLIVVGYGIIMLVKNFNKWHEKILVEKIRLFEPEQRFEDNKIFLKKPENPNQHGVANLEKALREMEEKKAENDEGLEEFEEESEVMLTSWDALPRDFGIADLEMSEYEEFRKKGIRDIYYGNRKIFRIMMESVQPEDAKGKLDELLSKYEVVQADNVRPGTYVPGGLYYNIFVPRKNLKNFLGEVMEVEESVLYETRTRIRNPPGKNRVFIWIKIL